uniref:Uncharacterized protein n=1 Tax=Daphnia magna TaxID=35525 RepID=A0A0P6JBG0_9CRUS
MLGGRKAILKRPLFSDGNATWIAVKLSVRGNHLDRINSQNISVIEKYLKKCSKTSIQETLKKCFCDIWNF